MIASLDNGVGELGAELGARLGDDVRLFASANIDTAHEWEALGGIEFRW